MPSARNQTIYDLIRLLAPFETQAAFDNAGFLIGDPSAPLSRVLVALDCSPAVVREAVHLGAQLIVAHHPLLFHPVKELRDDQYEGGLLNSLVRQGLSLISAHTNLDQSPLSAARLFAQALQLRNLRPADDYLLLGDLPRPFSQKGLGERLSRLLKTGVRSYGSGQAPISTLAIAGGAYCEGYVAAMRAGAQALLTGEVRHHNAVAAAAQGFVIYDGGHAATEQPMMAALSRYLQKQLNDLEYSVRVFTSEQDCCPETHLCKEDA